MNRPLLRRPLSQPARLQARAAAVLLLAGAAASAWAQGQTAAPDGGQILRQTEQRPPAPPAPGTAVQLPPNTGATTPAGGPRVAVTQVQFSGQTVFTEAALQALVADALGSPLDLAELRALADRVSTHYRAAGYPFARALLPPQTLGTGALRIQVVEGRYGRVTVTAPDAAWQATGEAMLAGLKPGEVISTGPLERGVLLLGDLPGVRASAVMQPGDATGTGDLAVALSRTAPLTGFVSLDNHGNRYSGRHRVTAGADWHSPFTTGDQLSLRALGSDGDLWLGSASYAAPLPMAGHGLRGSVSLAHTRYELGKEFAGLGATGTAEVAGAGLAWPMLRSSTTNLRLGMQIQHKRLHDRQVTLDDRKRSTSLPITLEFDHRDSLGGGGLSYGTLSWTGGRLAMSGAAAARDDLGTRGRFQRVNLDVVRQQALPGALQGWVRASGQWSDGNLDSSERVSLGGAQGVRAYPSGEATGDRGWLLQAELRWQAGPVTPFAFADAGVTQTQARPLPASGANQRKLAGAGVGVRWQQGAIDAQLAAAWRTHGGPAQSEGGRGSQPRVWAQVAWRF